MFGRGSTEETLGSEDMAATAAKLGIAGTAAPALGFGGDRRSAVASAVEAWRVDDGQRLVAGAEGDELRNLATARHGTGRSSRWRRRSRGRGARNRREEDDGRDGEQQWNSTYDNDGKLWPLCCGGKKGTSREKMDLGAKAEVACGSAVSL
jgi:hypothetical protein